MSIEAIANQPCYLNGTFTVLGQAQVSVMDRGFIFGDGVYEVVPVYGGKPFRFEQHMARLERSLQAIDLPNPMTAEQWRAVMQALVQRLVANGDAAADGDQMVYLQITRGVAPREHAMPKGLTPTVFLTTQVLKPVPLAQRAAGAACVTAEDFRWQMAHIKSISLLGAVLSRQISANADATETVMFRGQFLSEAAASNVWVVKDGTVLGPQKNHLVLEGVRFDLLAQLCQACGLGYALRDIGRDEVWQADELLLTSATKEVLAITSLDGHTVGHASHRGQPGPVYAQLYEAYQRAKQDA